MSMDTKTFIETCDFISMDTSPLMETKSLLNFLANYKPTILQSGRTIFIYKEVIAELLSLRQGPKQAKANQAENALQILANNVDLFRLECPHEQSNVNLHNKIADQRFIGAVTWYKTQHTQLFISNDKALLGSIVTAGELEAVQGNPVHAANLSEDGQLIEFEYSRTDCQTVVEMNDRYAEGQFSGMLLGGFFSAVIVGGLSFLLHTQANRRF